MTEIAGDALPAALSPARLFRGTARAPAPIVPEAPVGGVALAAVIAIMCFLSCLALGAVSLVHDTARVWQTAIAREATVQIKPREGLDMERALQSTAERARATPGVSEVRIVDREATARLLEPWLGANLDLDALPVPRLVIVSVDRGSPPDWAAFQAGLEADGFGAVLDSHQTWVDRLVAMAESSVWVGAGVLALMLGATALSVVFATRGAMAGAGHIIEVLHFVGAERRFIAAEFRRHFLVIGLKGAAVGGGVAALAFVGFGVWSAENLATPGATQAAALFGRFAIGPTGYAGVALVTLATAGLTALTSYLTVLAYLSDLDSRSSPDP